MILSDGFEVLWHQAGATSQSFDLEFYGSCQSMNSKRLQQGRPNLALHLCGNCHNLSHLRVLGCYNDARQEGPSTKNLWVQTGCLDWVGLLDMCTATIWWVHDSQGIRESTLHHFATEHGPSMAGYSHIVRAGEKFTPIQVVLVGPTLDDSYRYLAWVRIQRVLYAGQHPSFKLFATATVRIILDVCLYEIVHPLQSFRPPTWGDRAGSTFEWGRGLETVRWWQRSSLSDLSEHI